jgi:hypothetical protein
MIGSGVRTMQLGEDTLNKRVSFQTDVKVRTVNLSPGSDHLFLPKVSSRNPIPRVPYNAPDHSWVSNDHTSITELPDAEPPQILMAAIPNDENLNDFEMIEENQDRDYNVNDAFDYSDSNLSICMAKLLPYSDSIVIPITINGLEVLALVDTGATHMD